MFNFISTDWIEQLEGCQLLVVGDIMLDRFVQGRVERISPEAPIPVLQVEKEQLMLGGAGNVACNSVAVGVRTKLVGLIGRDDWGGEIVELSQNINGLDAHLISSSNVCTTVKTRYASGPQQLLRADIEHLGQPDPSSIKELIKTLEGTVQDANAILISDYGKGTIEKDVLSTLVDLARKFDIPIIADPKGTDFSKYNGVSVLTPNAKELSSATQMPVTNGEEAEKAAHKIINETGIRAIVVTRGREGMSIVDTNSTIHLPVNSREVFDVSGAGDTVVAIMGTMIASGIELHEAAKIANAAAGVVVAKVGTAVACIEEIVAALDASEATINTDKISSLKGAQECINRWRVNGDKIAFTNGCFDLIHPGHISLLRQARSSADHLIVGLNTDESVRRLKGRNRPIQDEGSRAEVLSSLSDVDLVIFFSEDTPIEIIKTLKPDILVKGADYAIDEVVGGELVTSYGGKILLAELTPGDSSSNIIERIEKVGEGGN